MAAIKHVNFMLIGTSEQLDAIENALGRVNGCLHETEEDLKNLEKCCGICVLPWNM